MKIGSANKMTARGENANTSKRYKNIMGTRSEVARKYTSEATSSGPILETVNGRDPSDPSSYQGSNRLLVDHDYATFFEEDDRESSDLSYSDSSKYRSSYGRDKNWKRL